MKNIALPLLGTALLLAACGGDPAPAADTTKPTVAFTSTLPTTPGYFTLTVNATDNVSVTKVEFYRNGTLITTDNSAPYTTTVTLDQRDNGTTFSAKAYDAAGNVGQSSATAAVNINTLYQGDWGWAAVNPDGSFLSGGSVTLFDQDAGTYGTVALGAYATLDTPSDFKGPQTLQGLAVLGPTTGSGRLQLRFATDFQGSDLYLLADDDNNALEDLEGSPAFFDDDAEVYVNPTDTQPQIAQFLMIQLTGDPTLDDILSSNSLMAQAGTQKANLLRLATVAGKLDRAARLNALTKTQLPLADQLFPLLKQLGHR